MQDASRISRQWKRCGMRIDFIEVQSYNFLEKCQKYLTLQVVSDFGACRDGLSRPISFPGGCFRERPGSFLIPMTANQNIITSPYRRGADFRLHFRPLPVADVFQLHFRLRSSVARPFVACDGCMCACSNLCVHQALRQGTSGVCHFPDDVDARSGGVLSAESSFRALCLWST